MTRSATDPVRCRSCGADVLWAEWASGKKMPVDAEPDMRPPPKGGSLVLSRRDPAGADKLIVEKWREEHGSKRNRYTSHFATCPNAGDWRRE
jgi:hypothetical protein